MDIKFFDLTEMSTSVEPGQNVQIQVNVKSDNLADVTFLVGEKEEKIVSHRILLSLSNNVFKQMFIYPGIYKNDPVVKIPDENPHAYRELLRYILTQDVNLKVDNMLNIYKAARRYEVDKLVKLCTDFIIDNIDESNLLDIYKFILNFDDPPIKDKCASLIMNNPTFYFSSDKFDDLSANFLKYIEEQLKISLTERDLFIIAMKWCINVNSEENLLHFVNLSESFASYLAKNQTSFHKPQPASAAASDVKVQNENCIYVEGFLKMGTFKGADTSILGVEALANFYLNKIGYYVGSHDSASESQQAWLIICEHATDTSTSDRPASATQACKMIYKERITFYYKKHVVVEHVSFDTLLFEKGKSYGIQFIFNLDDMLRPIKDYKKIERVYYNKELMALSSNNIMKLITNSKHETNNVIITSLFYNMQ